MHCVQFGLFTSLELIRTAIEFMNVPNFALSELGDTKYFKPTIPVVNLIIFITLIILETLNTLCLLWLSLKHRSQVGFGFVFMVSDSDSQFRIRKSNTKLENLKVIF